MFKRISLFLITNFAMMIMLMFIANLLGLNSYLTPYGINYEMLAGFALLWGMGGAFISLLISKPVAKWSMKVKVIDPNTASGFERDVVHMVHNLARGAKISKMPEVGIYQSPEINAFATGATKNSSLVAVSSGLCHSMNKDQLEGVLGHEVAHIANGDMVTMTLIQGVMNAAVIFLAKAIAFAAEQAMRGEGNRGPSYMLRFGIEMVLYVVLGFASMLVVNWFSRQREFRADKGSAQLAGANKMIAGLEALKSSTQMIDKAHAEMATLKIASPEAKGFKHLFSTHPSLDERIERLKQFA